MTQRTRDHAGFTLIELMIVMGMLALVTAHILSIFSSQLQTYQGQKAAVETQDDARLVTDLIFFDVRMAGFMIPRGAAISAVDGGTGNADSLCVSDPSVLDDARVAIAIATTDRFDGASLAANLGAGATSVDLDGAERDIDGDGDDDFAIGSGLIVADGTSNHCARITGIASGTVSFTPATPAGFAASTTAGAAVPAVIYQWTAGLTRNALTVSRQVEDLQVEFGVDANDDGQLSGGEFPIHGLFGSDASRVRLVRLSVLARAAVEDQQLTGSGRQAVANRTAAATADDYRRRLVSVSAAPRNLM